MPAPPCGTKCYVSIPPSCVSGSAPPDGAEIHGHVPRSTPHVRRVQYGRPRGAVKDGPQLELDIILQGTLRTKSKYLSPSAAVFAPTYLHTYVAASAAAAKPAVARKSNASPRQASRGMYIWYITMYVCRVAAAELQTRIIMLVHVYIIVAWQSCTTCTCFSRFLFSFFNSFFFFFFSSFLSQVQSQR